MSTLDASMDDVRAYLPLSAQQFQILLALSDADERPDVWEIAVGISCEQDAQRIPHCS